MQKRTHANPETAKIVDFIASQRTMALSMREWKHRLAGFGFAIDDTDDGPVIATLPRHRVLCALPPELCA